MARATKKKKELTIEEKLAEALVPESEQPYPVPDNWCWIRLLESFTNQTDTKKKIQLKEYLGKGAFAIVDQGQDIIGGYTDDINMTFSGKLPVIIFGDHTRCVKYIDFPFAQGADGVKVLVPKSCFLPKAFYYDLRSIDIPNMGYRRHYPLFKNYSIALPPLPEQQRIVDRIESLFAKLDEAKDKAQAVVDGFEDRKAAILHKAFTGELTAGWRFENRIGKENWYSIPFDKIANAIDPQPSHRTPPISGDGVPYIGIAECNYETGLIDFESARKVSKAVLEEHLSRYQLSIGNFIIGKIGTVGKPFRIPSEQSYTLSANIILIQPYTDKVSPDFLFYFFKSDFAERQFKEGIKATTQAAFGIKKVRNMMIALPPMSEQNEIVRILEAINIKEAAAKKAAEQVISQIDVMKKSILARAFRGELGTNDPADESAMELLKRIL